ncbi:MAG TPA: adenylate/guanylate cyclase domain-containing protein [Candidatus Baltobacteraceae bacterium]|nr:adenylate/guanylate cyclase domain-containing protein [Candidatus Baltobacteraceae bacterium]
MQQLERIAPTGPVAFLFSDIEGSTARWTMYPDAMPAYLRRHDDLLRESVERHAGLVFKTVGDEVCAVFSDANDALEAAITAQRTLAREDWSEIGGLRVRMALHFGAASRRDGDYFGSTVNRVARLLAAGHGGQVLVSADAAEALNETGRSALRDLGRHRLKDFPELQTIFQLVAPELPEIFPPLRTIAERPSNLPQHVPELVGREADADSVAALLQEHRFVTVAGAGGVGKTALALTVGSQLLQGFEDGAWLAELAPVDANAVPTVLASLFGITVLSTGSVVDALIAQIKSKDLLLIVDNCEHVVDAARSVLRDLLRACPRLRILVTSREPLRVPGEFVYRLPVLAVPPVHVRSAERLRSYAACALFEERARAHAASFAITDENATAVADICRRLDGIPLAIELAAPRLRVLGVAQLCERLRERFRLLTGGRPGELAHHQTLRALIQWSFELLGENERVLLQRSAVFLGGWTIGAAVEVCADDAIGEWDILDHLASLVDKSLIVAEAGGDEQRYRMLESTREFALERLDEAGARDAVAQRHAQYYAAFAQRADEAWADVPAPSWLAPVLTEIDNFRAALSWCVSQRHDVALGLAVFGRLEAFWWDAQPAEGRRWMDELRDAAETTDDKEAAARYWLTCAGVALSTAQEKLAVSAAERALEAYEALEHTLGIAAAHRCRGAALMRLGKVDEGEAAAREALERLRTADHRRLVALALRTLAIAPVLRGDLCAAGELYREALAHSQALQDERGVQIISGNLAEIEACGGNYEAALEHGREALEIARTCGERVIVCTLLTNLAAYLLALERFGECRSTAREALVAAFEIGSEMHVAVTLQHLAASGANCGDAARAARLLGYVDAVLERLESTREPTEAREYDRAMAALADRLEAGELLANLRAGATMTPDAAKREALLS